MEIHPYAECWPELSPDELDELAEDIETNGIREPIMLYNGAILDGRNRYKAARLAFMAKADIPTVTYDGDDPVGYVISRNARRRHMAKRDIILAIDRMCNIRDGVTKSYTDHGANEQTDLSLIHI